MPNPNPYREALAALAVDIGVDPQALAERQELLVDGIVLAFFPVQRAGTPAIQLACKVGSLPPQPPPSLLRLLLQANTLGAATGGATLGLQHGADDLVLASAHALDTPAPALARACRALTDAAAAWSAALQRGLGQPGTAAAVS